VIKIDGLLWLLIFLGPLLLLQRALHRQIQAVLLLVTRRPEMTVALFSLLFFPGVLLHELSHYLMAKILGVPTGRFSLIPESLGGNRLRMGFVETASTDIFRDSLIGMAPLIAGGLFVAYVGIIRLDLLPMGVGLALGNLELVFSSLAASFSVPDFWLWFYLIVTVSSTMFPSPSDRRAWLPVALLLVFLIGLALLFGAGPWMRANLLPLLNDALSSVAVVFAISASVHLIVLIPIWIIQKLITSVTGLRVFR
jgi:hypothetical protein